jgi:hypothetical protein
VKVHLDLRYSTIMNNTSNRVGGFGMDTDGLEDDDVMDEATDESDDAPPSPREQFHGLIDQIQRASALVDTAYATMIEQARPFDKELVAKLQGAQKADRALFDYVQSKMEKGDDVPSTIVSGLLGR